MTIEQKAKAYDEVREKIAIRFGSNVADEIFSQFEISEDDRIRKAIKQHILFLDDTFPEKTKWLAWLEKQGEQKSFNYEDANIRQKDFAPKNEPKFHEGDWITFTRKDGTGEVLQVSDIIDGRYYFNHLLQFSWSIKECNEKCHLWTIQDVKSGDVLSDGTTIFIFKDLMSDGSVMSYCDYDTDSGESDAFCPLSMNLMCSKITPATKEQRDALERAITNAGYEWDTEKKELKEIEEEVNGEDYGIDSLYHAQRILEKTLGSVDGYQSDDGILEHKCAISAVKKLYEQKAAWSEEDEKMLNDIIMCGERHCYLDAGNIAWLKSLRPQKQWTPSEEQMKALYAARHGNCFNVHILESLFNDLKQLKQL